MKPIYFVPEARNVPLYGERGSDYSYHLCELIPFYHGSEVSDVIPIDTVRYTAGEAFRSGSYTATNVWTLDWGAPWDTNEWTNRGSHELVDPAGNRYAITGNNYNTLTITVGATDPLDGNAFIAPKQIYLNSTEGFASGKYAFAPGSHVVRAIAINPESNTVVRVYGVGGLSSNPWVQNRFNASPSGFSRYLLIDSNRNLYKITKTDMGTSDYNSPYHYAKLTLDILFSYSGGQPPPIKGPALIVDASGFIEYSGVGYHQTRGGYLNDVTVYGGFIPKNSTIIGAPFESRKERGESMRVGWLGTTTDQEIPDRTIEMASRIKVVLNDNSSSDWVGDFVDTTSSEIVLINDPTSDDVLIEGPEKVYPSYADSTPDITESDEEVTYRFTVKSQYDPGTPVAAYIWSAVPSSYNPDIELRFEDISDCVLWVPEYDAHYDIYLKVVGVNGAETNPLKVTANKPIIITGRSTDFPWGDPTVDAINFDDWNNVGGTLASYNFDGDPEDILDNWGTEGIALNFSKGNAVFSNIIARGTGIIGGWVIDGDRLYDETDHIELNAGEERIKVNDGTQDRVFVGKIGDDYGIQINDVGGNELIGMYGTTANLLGWTAEPNFLYNDNGASSVGMAATDSGSNVAFWAGNTKDNRASAPFRAFADGQIELGGVTNYIIIDGPDEEIRNSTFQAGNRGWRIMSAGGGTAEFNDIIARGNLSAKTMVFQETVVTRGTFMVTKSGGELHAAATATATTFTIDITKSFSTASAAPLQSGDRCLLSMTSFQTTASGHEELAKTWVIVGAGSDNGGAWEFWRFTATYQNGSDEATYPAGTSLIDFGGTGGGGGVKITADASTAPYVDIFTNNSTPWNGLTSVGRLGKMDGYHGLSGETYGFGFGAYPGGNYIHYDSVSGELIIAGDIVVLNPGDQDNIKVFYQSSGVAFPVSIHIGDLWFDTVNGYEVLYSAHSVGADSFDPGDWELVDREAIRTFRQGPGVPTSVHIGDLWYDTSDNNRLYVAASVGATTKGDGEWEGVDQPGITTFYQSEIPTSNRAGDIWYHTGQDETMYFAMIAGADEIKDGEWQKAQEKDLLDNALAAATALEIADGEIVGYYVDEDPGAKFFGDIWIDITGGNPDINDIYRFEDTSGGSQGSLDWRSASDNAIGLAFLKAYDAKTTADGKIVTFYEANNLPISPVGDEGDLWINSSDNKTLYRAFSDGSDAITSGKWEEVQDDGIDEARQTANWNITDISGLLGPLADFNKATATTGGLRITGDGLGYMDADDELRSFLGSNGDFYLSNGVGNQQNALAYIAASGVLILGSRNVNEAQRIEISSVDHNMKFRVWDTDHFNDVIILDDNIFTNTPGIKINNGLLLINNTTNMDVAGTHISMLYQTAGGSAINALCGNNNENDRAVQWNFGPVGIRGVGWSAVGVSAKRAAGTMGVGIQETSSSLPAYGTYGYAAAASGATAYAVYGTTINEFSAVGIPSGGTHWAGYFKAASDGINAVHIRGNLTITGTVDGIDINSLLDVTAGQVTASRALVVDASKNLSNASNYINNLRVERLYNKGVNMNLNPDAATTCYLIFTNGNKWLSWNSSDYFEFNDDLKADTYTADTKFLAPNGSQAGPAYSFTGDLDTGFYWTSSGGDGIGVSMDNSFEFLFEKDGDFHADKDVIAYSATTSDIRLKKNIVNIDTPLDRILKLRGINYEWKNKDDGLHAGLIAQEVEKFIPEVVIEHLLPLHKDDGKKYKTIRYNELVPYLVEAIKEQQVQINNQKKEIDELKLKRIYV